MLVNRLISKLSNGTIFGTSKIGRAIGWIVTIAIIGGFIYLMSI